ncbi:heavy metal translocating P-type ATPase [Epilithonimonas arachidiradicis]|uniref:P-type Zn(2+) transporter n=2 Tax=Epilithonimonas arachidiradicis TaxID=1617282 RepID=A0A420CPU0_9FLAO|nr:heavy metal translocating P-type ATPase [Epilithonimonas arachidiradicis]RKE80396.1 Cd2+/Zn2+-exporting ATPase [Epilithonimonas arachidiradicis]
MANCSSGCCETDQHQEHSHQHNHSDHDHSHGSSKTGLIISLIIFFSGLFLDFWLRVDWFTGNQWLRFGWYFASYILVAFLVFKEAFELARKLDFFNEFSLMGIATIGAFAIGEFPEGVAVMLFYTIGEMFQESAVNRARNNIKSLLDVRPKEATVFRDGNWKTISPEDVKIGEKIRVKVGEKIPLDGVLLSEKASLNTSALTGESKPSSIQKSEEVLAGMLNLDQVVEIETTKLFENSSIVRILQMVQDASSRKAKTELFIRRFAKIYTPIVFVLALLVTLVPYVFVENYIFRDWLYRGLVFLVISCPCALVISIPLGYFGGIGAASRNGILFKGSNFLDIIANVTMVVMDKTGTMTKGVFKVQDIVPENISKDDFLSILSSVESHSTHPIAKAVSEFHPSDQIPESVEELSGKGIKAVINQQRILAGNTKLLKTFNINYPEFLEEIVETTVVLAIDNEYKGYITISDEVKDDSELAINNLKNNGIKTVMLSGDKDSLTQNIAKKLGIDSAFGGLLPEGKVEKLENLKSNPKEVIAFVGDGINDAPVLALSDVGIAMGGLGSDAAIETADVVIQTDQPSKIATAIKIGKATKKIVYQNIGLAFGVKIIVLILGAGGLANMWEAVFADVGVALLAILNAVRIQNMKFD